MKRYWIDEYGPGEDSEGQWVKWEDVKAMKDNLDMLEKQGKELVIKGELLEASVIECNCAEMAGQKHQIQPVKNYCWVCPAHGYKKL